MLDSLSLFFGALLDATIGPNMFIPGEPFLIAAGYQLHQGIIWGVVAALSGSWLGDQFSYALGRLYGPQASRKLTRRWSRLRRPVARCRLLMQTRGTTLLVFARLLGPVAWFVAFMAGSSRIGWQRFAVFSFIGLLVGGGQFVMAGYLLAAGAESWLPVGAIQQFLIEHQLLLWSVSIAVLFHLLAWKRGLSHRWMRSAVVLLLCLAVANINYSDGGVLLTVESAVIAVI